MQFLDRLDGALSKRGRPAYAEAHARALEEEQDAQRVEAQQAKAKKSQDYKKARAEREKNKQFREEHGWKDKKN